MNRVWLKEALEEIRREVKEWPDWKRTSRPGSPEITDEAKIDPKQKQKKVYTGNK